ncbi:MAG: excinuclease ABC subunit UvrC [Oscillospiraceae bacterium]|nr:excinuclease ABC subunit UvrC [Oscillospiraceae bacterium]
MNTDALREKANRLPMQPGVYLMKDETGTVIYVGKAKSLKNRVSQYFRSGSGHSEKTRRMVSKVDDFDVIAVRTEFEALVLENAQIKRHMPRYNILLKDDKGYPYLRLSVQEEYPRFSMVRVPADDGARYFGPFGGRTETRAVIDAVCAALKLPTCSRRFPREIGRERPCLNYHMGLCDGYCLPPGEPERYRAAVDHAVLLLEGRHDEVTANLRQEMEAAAEDLRFERAAELRDRLRAVETLSRRQQNVVAFGGSDLDAVGYFEGEPRCCLAVLHYRDGELAGREIRLFRPGEEEDLLSAAVRQFYGERESIPREILLPRAIDSMDLVAQFLSEQAGHPVRLASGVRGNRRAYVVLAGRNAEEEAERAATREEKTSALLFSLQKLLDMERPPVRIEAFDISHTAGQDPVASMTVFENARPRRSAYRRYQIKTAEGGDDYGAMKEVLTRRLRRWEDASFGNKPDLFLIDGGQGQTAAVLQILQQMQIFVPVYGMVKDDRHRTRALVTAAGREIGLTGSPALFALIGRIQEETHRFAITYHRERQSKQMKKSALDGIPGVGPARKAALLKAFGSVKAIKAAGREELAKAVPANVAENVYTAFHK